MGTLGNNISNFMVPLILLLIFVPSSESGILDKLKTAWNNVANPYPFTSTLQLTSHIRGSLRVACVLDEGIRKMATIKTGQSFSFQFKERSADRNNMMCFLWQRGKEIGWFYPLYFGTGPCDNATPSIWTTKYRNLCKRHLYTDRVVGSVRSNGQTEIFPYAPIKDKFLLIAYPALKPS